MSDEAPACQMYQGTGEEGIVCIGVAVAIDENEILRCQSCMEDGIEEGFTMKPLGKQLGVFHTMGGTLGVGWKRDDVNMIHLFANVAPGEKFQPTSGSLRGPHWPCNVCDSHRFTEKDFHDQIQSTLDKGPAPFKPKERD